MFCGREFVLQSFMGSPGPHGVRHLPAVVGGCISLPSPFHMFQVSGEVVWPLLSNPFFRSGWGFITQGEIRIIMCLFFVRSLVRSGMHGPMLQRPSCGYVGGPLSGLFWCGRASFGFCIRIIRRSVAVPARAKDRSARTPGVYSGALSFRSCHTTTCVLAALAPATPWAC